MHTTTIDPNAPFCPETFLRAMRAVGANPTIEALTLGGPRGFCQECNGEDQTPEQRALDAALGRWLNKPGHLDALMAHVKAIADSYPDADHIELGAAA